MKRARAKNAAADALTRIGSLTSRNAVRAADSALNYVEVGRWMKAKGFVPECRLNTRHEVFDAIGREILGERVLYLEFGVFKGASMRKWSALLNNPASQLHGFDKFVGLPELWQGEMMAYSAGGIVPAFDDSRVVVHTGWFSETLPCFTLPEHDRLVINIDADLYSSTKYVLEALVNSITVGAFLYFDEFQFRDHELKAFEEHLAETRYQYRLVACSVGLRGVAFQRTV